MNQRPLDDEELKMVRGMIDEYEFAHRRHLLASQRWKSWRVILLSVLGFVLYTLQIVVAIVAIKGH